jgi:hypothetical protein
VAKRSRKRSAERSPPPSAAPPTAAAKAPPSADAKADAYERHRERMAERSREQSAARREIGPLPAVKNPERRAKALTSLESFESTYLSHIFTDPLAQRHKNACARLQEVAEVGGKYALAMPRGDGKTQHGAAAMLFAACKGLRQYIVLIGATGKGAEEVRACVKGELETNELLLEDFPEICYPIRCIEGITLRTKGQTLDGKATKMQWSEDRIVLPTVAGSVSSGICLEAQGIEGRLRGMSFKRPDGTVARPDFVILDDPQTDESARAPSQCLKRMSLIRGTIENLGSHKRDIAVVALVTVICEGDVSDELLNRDKSPEYRGERYPLVESMPKRLDLWERYREIQREEMKAGKVGYPLATEFYRANFDAMNEGAVVPWEHRYIRGLQLSAIQYAMDLWLSKPESFAAEMQQRPLKVSAQDERALDPDDIVARLSGVPRGIVPSWATKLTGFVDIGEHVLAWAVVAWKDGFTGSLVDFGTWPRQPTNNWTKDTLKATLEQAYPQLGREARWYAGLDEVGRHILAQPWRRSSGDTQTVDMMLIDAGMGDSYRDDRPMVPPQPLRRPGHGQPRPVPGCVGVADAGLEAPAGRSPGPRLDPPPQPGEANPELHGLLLERVEVVRR